MTTIFVLKSYLSLNWRISPLNVKCLEQLEMKLGMYAALAFSLCFYGPTIHERTIIPGQAYNFIKL